MTNMSTPLSHLSRPNISTNAETSESSFISVASIPNVPELIQTNPKQCCSKLYKLILLLGVFLCCSLLIYIVVRIQFYLKLSAGVNSDFGNVNVTFQSEGELNLTSKLNSTIEETPSQLWKQQYVELLEDSP